MRKRSYLLVFLAACADQPYVAGDGIDIDANHKVSVKGEVVRMAPCKEGEFVTHGSTWSCEAVEAGEVKDFSTAAKAAAGEYIGPKADTNPMNHDRYTDDEAVE